MNIADIRSIVEAGYTVQQLQQAEEAIVEGLSLTLEIPGVDEGEKLTHILAAIWVHNRMAEVGCTAMDAIREYSKKVRASIG